jgi:hypothetical protein
MLAESSPCYYCGTSSQSNDTNETVKRMKKALDGEKEVVMISPADDLVML